MEFRGKFLNASRNWKTGKLEITFTVEEGNMFDINGLPDKDLWISTKLFKRHRSLDSNAYAWVLLSKIATALKISKEEAYCKAIMENPSSPSTFIIVKENAMQKVREAYRVTKDLGPIKVGEQEAHQLQIFFGSSTYDSGEMARFIDWIQEDAKSLGIETLPPEEVERMNQAWATQQ